MLFFHKFHLKQYIPCLNAHSPNDLSSSLLYTEPVGLFGLFNSIALVFSVIVDSNCSIAILKLFSLFVLINTGFPPLSLMISV